MEVRSCFSMAVALHSSYYTEERYLFLYQQLLMGIEEICRTFAGEVDTSGLEEKTSPLGKAPVSIKHLFQTDLKGYYGISSQMLKYPWRKGFLASGKERLQIQAHTDRPY